MTQYIKLIFCLSTLSSTALANGLLIYKEQGFHSDNQARLVEYVTAEVIPQMVTVTFKSGNKLDIPVGRSPVIIPFVKESTEEPDNIIKRIDAALPRFPQHKLRLETIKKDWIFKNEQIADQQKKTKASTVSLSPSSAAEPELKFRNGIVTKVYPDGLLVSSDGGVAKIPISTLTPDELVRFGPMIQQKSTDAAELEKRKIEDARKADLIAAQKEYYITKKGVERWKRKLDTFIGPDQGFAKLLIQDGDELVAVFENGGSEEDKLNAYKTHEERWKSIRETKPVVGYSYNEILKKEVITPIQFNIFNDEDEFYIKVGDGDFCTIAPIPIDDLVKLAEQFDRVSEWANQCSDKHLNARKNIGRFGKVDLEFISTDDGDTNNVFLTARGPFGRDRIFTEQTVRLNMFNWGCLRHRILNAKSVTQKRDENRRNAEKLK